MPILIITHFYITKTLVQIIYKDAEIHGKHLFTYRFEKGLASSEDRYLYARSFVSIVASTSGSDGGGEGEGEDKGDSPRRYLL